MSSSDKRPTHGFGMSHTTHLSTSFTSPNFNTAADQSELKPSTSPSPAKQISISSSEGPTKLLPRSQQPSTPLGKVVDPGHEHTGRWTREEHESFLAGLKQYGKEWKKVAAKVKTRTVVQTRTHAQKYFQKLQKGMTGDKCDIDIDLNLIESKKGPSGSSKKKALRQKLQKQSSHNIAPSSVVLTSQKLQSALNTQAAAQLMAMSKVKPSSSDKQSSIILTKPPPPPAFFASADPHSNSHFGRNAPVYHNHHQHHQQEQQHQLQPQQQQLTKAITTNNGFGVSMTTEAMKIIPPKPGQMIKKNMFPEPSPAACGSRKVIELAAAQMLAGVAAIGERNRLKASEEFSGKTTPPLQNKGNGHDAVDVNKHVYIGEKRPAIGAPGSLQIVNPDSLGVSLNSGKESKRPNLGQEPVTPWDGQIEALGSEVKNKEKEQQNVLQTAMSDAATSNPGGAEDEFVDHPLSQNPTTIRDALHTAVCNGNIKDVEQFLKSSHSTGGTINSIEEMLQHHTAITIKQQRLLNAIDGNGFCPLHCAVSLKQNNLAAIMTQLLLSFGADPACKDKFDNSPLHWAVRAGNEDVAQILVSKTCPLDLQNQVGETALHWAMRTGKIGMEAVRVLLENGARSSIFNNDYKRPIDVAAEKFVLRCEGADDLEVKNKLEGELILNDLITEKRQSRMNLLCFSPQSRTLVLHHPECLDHVAKSESDWEVPDRVTSIMDSMASNVREYEIQISSDFDRASLELLSRVHSAEYLTFVNDLSKELEKRRKDDQNSENQQNAPVVPFTPMVQRTMRRDGPVKKGTHSDTSFSSGSLRAARRAAGAVQHAVDCVLVGRNRNAFCVVRPPGHHAGINGLLAGGESCGFCIFNNVAAGAMHALSNEGHRPKCQRCAIVDIDAHHGNGTEEIVKKCDDPGRLFFFSVHVYDNDKKKRNQNAYKFYPGTGEEDDVAHNIVNVPIAPLWREKDLIQSTKSFQSATVNEVRHNTRNKAKQKAAAAASAAKDANVCPSETDTKDDISNGGSNNRLRSPKSQTPKSTPPHYFQGTGREAYRRAIQQRLLPALRAFNPDLIILSIGFDASKGDVGNARHYVGGKEAEGINLEPEDYAWTTSRILEVADICCQGRVVSVLEGGYGRTPTSTDASSNDIQDSDKLDKSVFSECAVRHLRAMIDPFDEERLNSGLYKS